MLLDTSFAGRQTAIRLLEKQLRSISPNEPQFLATARALQVEKLEYVAEIKKIKASPNNLENL